MKHKFAKILGVGLTLALLASMLVTATPVSADHTSTATVVFADGESAVAGEDSILDVEVNNAMGSPGAIKKVKIDFGVGDFGVIGPGIVPDNWTGVGPVDGVVTYTADAGFEIAPEASLTFSPAVTNPAEHGTNKVVPEVKTTDTGSAAAVVATADTGWIGYVADSLGAGGNEIDVVYVNPGYPDRDLSVSVAVQAITVSLATDGDAALISTAAQVAAAITANADADAIVDATADPLNLDYTVQPLTVSALTGGTNPQEVTCAPADPLEVFASFEVTATPTPATSAATASYLIGFTTITPIPEPDGTIVITFAEGYDISAVSDVVGEDVTMMVGEIPVSYIPSAIAVDVGARMVTITATVGTGIAADEVVAITIANVGNPPVSGDYDITVAGTDPDTDTGTVTIVPDAFKVVAGSENTVAAGTPFLVTLQALNALAADDTGYIGANYIDFVWAVPPAVPADATIPDYELITFTAGEGTSPANFILIATGDAPTITATEGSLTGTSEAITINPGALASFTISDTVSTVAGEVFASGVTVEAFDAEGNRKTDYTGTVIWSSSDTAAGVKLPANYPFTTGEGGEDNGIHAFDAGDFILVTVPLVTVPAEPQTITVADGEVTAIDTVEVTAAAADSLTAEASEDFIVADGSDYSIITASAWDQFGNIVLEMADITFVTNLGVLDAFHETDGVVEMDLKSSELGMATIKVTSVALATTITLNVDLVATAVVDDIVVTVVKIFGENKYDVTATYKDADGYTVTPAVGDVTFSTDPAVIDSTTETPSGGVATLAQFTTELAPGTTITVTATGMGLTGTAVITVGVETDDITLVPGWNLISLPLIPTNSGIETVLAPILSNVDVVWGYDPVNSPDEPWSYFIPGIVEDDLTEMNDGEGFWVLLSDTEDLPVGVLVVSGYELCAPPPSAVPPQYEVVAGWNLIGYKFTKVGQIDAYLGSVIYPDVQATYGYNVATGLYDIPTTQFGPGCGYWIALTLPGTIYPEFVE
ncbi:hypothetical protein ES707_16637 [subsurface metagenome]